jgi:sodium-dependent dicarboxylate transporter 2/3/5
MKKKQIIGMVLAIAALVVSRLIAPFGGLTQEGMWTVGMLCAFLIMLVTEALPVVVTSLIFCGLMPLLGVTKNLGAALSGYSQPIVFFTLASFGIAAAITTIPLSKRILRALLRRFGKSIETVLLAMMICCAIVSSIVSNVPTCAIFMAISLDLIKLYPKESDQRRTGRLFMIGIPVASMIGGMMTPAGSSINLLAIAQLEQLTGTTVTFVQWMCAGIPLTAAMIPLAWWIMCHVYKPAPITEGEIHGFIDQMDIPEKMGRKEIQVLVIICIMLTLWILSSWISAISVMVVAILGCCGMFLPGIRVLDLDVFLRENSWDAFFLVGTVLSISAAMITNGVSDRIAAAVPAMHVSAFALIAFTAALIFAALLLIPVATSMIPIMAPPLVAMAAGAGVSPALLVMTAALCAGNCYLLPLDTVPLITYGKGYYSMSDMARSTVFLQMAMILLAALWLPVVGKLFCLV